MIRTFLAALVFTAATPAAHSQIDSFFGAASDQTLATLSADTKTLAPGMKLTVALQLQHPAGWHSYYLNSGGIELSPAIEWKLPPGFTAGPIQWPTPAVKDGYAGKSFVYESPVLLVDIAVPTTAKAGETVSLTAKATWQICAEGCRNEEQEFTLTLPVAAASEADPARAEFFKMARAKLPLPLAVWSATAFPSGADVAIRLSPKAGATPPAPPAEFIPNEKFLQPISAGGKVAKDGDDWVITLKRATKDMLEQKIPQGDSLSGILRVGEKARYAVTIPPTPIQKEATKAAVAAPPKPAKPPQSLGFFQLLLVLGGMLLGGLILNLMPCVFPVIGLKIMSFVNQAGHNRGKIIAHGLVFTLGVLVSFWVLSGILFVARQTGQNLNWGYQLQDPRVVLALMLLMFVLALNLFGLFEIGTSATSVGGNLQSKQGLIGSFFSGVLATVVATPCSGPFLGVAIGAAVGLPAFQFFAAFTAMAIGLSLPYLVLSAYPALVERLPRPGAWMESFKQGMSFLLFGTAGYLLWVYVAQIDAENMLGPVFGMTCIALAAWIYGRWFLPHRKPAVRRAAVILALLFGGGGVVLALPPAEAVKPAAPTAGTTQTNPKAAAPTLEWEPWTQARVDELLKEGHPVYIDFTAKWCPTCQANKKRAYTAEVIALMKEKGIVALRADQTKSNPEIDAKMVELGRTAIPVNVLQVPGKEPVITDVTLSPAYLLDLFRKEIPAK